MSTSKKSLIFSGITLTILVVFLALAVSYSLGWFANNQVVKAQGMSVEMEGVANIVAANTIADLNDLDKCSPSVNVSKDPAHEQEYHTPATHVDSGPALLKYVSNISSISKITGLPLVAAQFGEVPLNVNSIFYIDYIFYIGSIGSKLNGASLTATITTPADTTSFKGGASIDFYVNDTYKDTLNLAGYDYAANDYTTTKTEADLGTVDIPYYSSSNPVKITLRCYFDGALLKSKDQCFISSSSVSTDLETILSVKINVSGGSQVK